MKRLLSAVLIVFLLTAAGLAVLWGQYQKFLQTPLQIESPGMVIVVEPGTNIRSLAAKLEQQGVTRLDWRWRLLGRLKQVIIKTGEYELTPGLSPPDLLDLLASGQVVSYRFTIVEGWSVKQLVEALDKNPVLVHNIKSVAELEGLEGFPGGNPEGWFLP